MKEEEGEEEKEEEEENEEKKTNFFAKKNLARLLSVPSVSLQELFMQKKCRRMPMLRFSQR
jgi:hypothetical protein